jgi:hypothetical protein
VAPNQAARTGKSRFRAPTGSDRWETEVLAAARGTGRSLREYEADTGQMVWSWMRSDGTGPLFLTRRAALTWMAEVLERIDPQDL